MKRDNLRDFVEGLKRTNNPNKVNNEIDKIRLVLASNQKTIKDNLNLNFDSINESSVKDIELKKIRKILKAQ